MSHQLVCTVCPMGCRLTLTEDPSAPGGYQVTGNGCKRGIKYGIEELTHPVRVLTTTVRIQGGLLPRLPVRTDGPIPKGKLGEAMEAANKLCIQSPVEMGQILVSDFLGTGVNLIASRSL